MIGKTYAATVFGLVLAFAVLAGAAWGVAVDHPSILTMKKGLVAIVAEVVAKP